MSLPKEKQDELRAERDFLEYRRSEHNKAILNGKYSSSFTYNTELEILNDKKRIDEINKLLDL